jgi:hypothetical protein
LQLDKLPAVLLAQSFQCWEIPRIAPCPGLGSGLVNSPAAPGERISKPQSASTNTQFMEWQHKDR